jgi:hypothetical protein
MRGLVTEKEGERGDMVEYSQLYIASPAGEGVEGAS